MAYNTWSLTGVCDLPKMAGRVGGRIAQEYSLSTAGWAGGRRPAALPTSKDSEGARGPKNCPAPRHASTYGRGTLSKRGRPESLPRGAPNGGCGERVQLVQDRANQMDPDASQTKTKTDPCEAIGADWIIIHGRCGPVSFRSVILGRSQTPVSDHVL